MFYSHEILTSRRYGVATVWLVATLGSSSKLKRVNRKAIRDVDVPKACQTIIDPGAPMALRLQGNLLYGVSRVYLEQCGYVLSDAQSAQMAMRMMLKAVKQRAELDMEAGRARPEQLMLPDDPSFLPEFALPPPELSAEFNSLPSPGEQEAGDSQILTPFGSQIQQEQVTPEAQLGLVLPTSSSGAVGEFIIGYGDDYSGGVTGAMGGEGAVLLEADYEFDADGNIVDFEEDAAIRETPLGQQGHKMHGDAAGSARVRTEHDDGQPVVAEQAGDEMGLDILHFGEDIFEGEAAGQNTVMQHSEQPRDDSTSVSATAPQNRKPRKAKTIPTDTTMGLRNHDLADWNKNYLRNMAEASKVKNAHKALTQAKKNAEYWVWGVGFGGIGHRLPDATAPTPFDMFCGDGLYEFITGKDRRLSGRKRHGRDSGIDDETAAEARRVRPRLEEDESQIGRAHEDEGVNIMGDDEVELPRDEPAALDDQQLFSAMPWNISASIRGSSAIPRSTGLQGSLPQRGSRMVSDSPLKGRGQSLDMEALRRLSGDESMDIFGVGLPEQISSDGAYLEPEYVPKSPVRFRVHEALSAEGSNFLSYISDAINEKRQRLQAELDPMSDVMQAEAAADVDEVLFEEVLPPAENSKMIACQGLMMVLSLGTSGMLAVRQNEGFAEIGLRLTDKAKVVVAGDIVEEEGQEEGGVHATTEGGGGEQMDVDDPEGEDDADLPEQGEDMEGGAEQAEEIVIEQEEVEDEPIEDDSESEGDANDDNDSLYAD